MNTNSGTEIALKSLKESVPQLNFFSGLLEDGYDLRLKVTGRSMTPFLETGSYVTIARVPVAALKIGDIVFCRCEDESFKLHRLIQMTGKMLVTKGDALRACDPPFDKSDYKGKVIHIEEQRSDGILYRNMESPAARVLNYLIAQYYQLRKYFIGMCIRIKSKSVGLLL
jgi:signal peptidase I